MSQNPATNNPHWNPPGHQSVRCAHVYGDDQPHKRGAQCKRMCKFGFQYCNLHGGNTAPAVAAAEKAMALVRMPAIEALFNIVDQFNSEVCPTCGFPDGKKETQTPVIRAAQVILDRTGMPARMVHEVKQSDGERLDISRLSSDERAELTELTTRLRLLRARVKERMQPTLAAGGDPSGNATGSVAPDRVM